MKTISQNKDAFLKPMVQYIPRAVQPNHITFIRLALVIPVIFAFFEGAFMLVLLLYILGVFLDALDGTLARIRNVDSKLGAILDPIADKALFATILILFGIFLLPVNLFVTIIVLEICVLLGSAFYMAMNLRKTYQIPVQANALGKVKITLYAFGSIALILSVYSSLFQTIAIGIFWLATFVSLTGGVSYLMVAARPPVTRQKKSSRLQP